MIKVAAAIAFALISLVAHADSASDDLGSCLVDNTTGKERKELARWVFIAMSAHPEIQELSKVTAQDKEKANKDMANLVTKLMTESCVSQTKAVAKGGGADGFKAAFEILGRIAMQEIATSPKVAASFSDYTKYLDQGKFTAVLGR